jgi:hypothetical protein
MSLTKPWANWNPSATYQRLLVGLVALTLRGGLGFVFFGSIDVANNQSAALRMFEGKHPLVPYFPIVPSLVWLAGVLNFRTSLPLAFCSKMMPLLFDGLMAMLVYDVMARRSPTLAFRGALLYAFSPIALLITCHHGNWEPICLFFLLMSLNLVDDPAQGPRARLLAGACFAMSVLVKPMTVICLPFLFPPLLPAEGRRRRLRESFETAMSMATVMVASFIVFHLFGYNLIELIRGIWQYAKGGVQVFGLPFLFGTGEFGTGEPGWTRRSWIVPLLGLLAIVYHRGKLGRFESVLFSLSFPVGVAGISPQYLLWPMPFLLISRIFRLGAIYNLVTVPFLIVFYMTPDACLRLNQNMGTFATLRGFSWLMPPVTIGQGWMPKLLPLFGNLIVPVSVLAIAARAVGLLGKPRTTESQADKPHINPAPAYPLYLATVGALAGLLALFYATEDRETLLVRAVPAIETKLRHYDMDILNNLDMLGHYPSVSYLNIASLYLVVAAAWSLACYRLGREENRASVVPASASPLSQRFHGRGNVKDAALPG